MCRQKDTIPLARLSILVAIWFDGMIMIKTQLVIYYLCKVYKNVMGIMAGWGQSVATKPVASTAENIIRQGSVSLSGLLGI